MNTTPVKKTIAATAIAASTLGGIAAGATLFAPGLAGAQDGTDESTETEDVPGFGKHIADALQGLVDDGTLEDAQVDDIIEALEAARPERGDFGGRHHGPGRGFGGADIAGVLGLEQAELGEALRDGQSLADVAEAQGVAVDDVVDAIVTATEERLADAVESGRIDQEQSDEMLANAAERAEDMVNGEFEPGQRGFGRRGFGPGGPAGDADAPADVPAVNAIGA